jgi:hypothetical protein
MSPDCVKRYTEGVNYCRVKQSAPGVNFYGELSGNERLKELVASLGQWKRRMR